MDKVRKNQGKPEKLPLPREAAGDLRAQSDTLSEILGPTKDIKRKLSKP